MHCEPQHVAASKVREECKLRQSLLNCYLSTDIAEMGNCTSGRSTKEGTTRALTERHDSLHNQSAILTTPTDPNIPVFIAKYDYDSRTDDDLTFRKGDLLYIISTEEGDWWYTRHTKTGQEGYVPSNYIAEWKSLEAEE